MKIIDLSIPLKTGVNAKIKISSHPKLYLGHSCYNYDIAIKSHKGTYFETSSHVFRDGKNTDSIPLEKLFLNAKVIRLAPMKQREVTSELLESAKVKIRKNDALLVYTGWDRKSLHPYFTKESADWMVRKGISLIGSDTSGYDSGFDNPTGFFITLFKANIPIIANIKNLNKITKTKVKLIVMPLYINGAGTVPSRAVVLEG